MGGSDLAQAAIGRVEGVHDRDNEARVPQQGGCAGGGARLHYSLHPLSEGEPLHSSQAWKGSLPSGASGKDRYRVDSVRRHTDVKLNSIHNT